MRLICIKNTKSIYTDGQPVDQKYFKVGEQYDAQDDYKIDDQHFVIYDNGSRYSVYRRVLHSRKLEKQTIRKSRNMILRFIFITIEEQRHNKLNELGI